jgi:hypothetical protein
MPRGRKRPPQESIDSILLTMSRHDSIDPDTLAHYFDRLDEEWTEGARDKVLHLLRTRDTAAHAAAVLILTELATDFDLEAIEDLVADPTVTDVAKLTLAPVLRELNSEMADDALIEYLNDPEAAMQQMQVRLLDMVGKSELGVESVLEDVLSMPPERRLSFISWLGSSHDPRAANLLIPLLENPTSPLVTAAVDALEQLGPIAAQQSIPALNYLVAHTSNRQMKEHARAALGRLTMQLTPGSEKVSEQSAEQYQLPFYAARISCIDGVGAQMILLSWRRPDGLLKGVNVLYQDQWGIKDCYGTDDMPVERWVELITNLNEQGLSSVQVPLDYARALVAEARAMNKRSRRKLPIAYAIWRPLIEGTEQKSRSVASTATRLEAQELIPEMLQLAQRGNELYDLPEFSSWLFEPVAHIQPYIDRYWSQRTFTMLQTNARSSRRKNAQKQQQLQINLETLITEAIDALIDAKWQATYEARLLRQGTLFQFAGRTEDTQLVQAVASALHPNSGVAVQEQPFVRMMFRLSIEQGPLRALAEALDSGQLGPLPIDLFPEGE